MTINLECQSGKEELKTVNQFLKEKSEESEVILYWVEPQSGIVKNNELKPIPNFQGITQTAPDWNIVMEEAKLFWQDGMIHAVALSNGGCRWFECHEKPNEVGDSGVHDRIEYKILLRRDRDWDRFFGEEYNKPELTEVTVIEYRKNARLVAWRMYPIENE